MNVPPAGMTLANKITVVRILLVPLFVIGLLRHAPTWPLAIFLFCALTDMLDGAVARWRGERTELGAFLDPLADKLLLSCAYLVLAAMKLVPMWVFVLVVSRDLLIALGWGLILLFTKRVTFSPRWCGKMTTFLQSVCVIVALSVPGWIGFSAMLNLMAIVTAVSAIDYVWVGMHSLSELS